MNCSNCGAEILKESKFCSYCGKEINKYGKVFNQDAFIVTDVFSISNRILIIGKAVQPLKVGDKLTKNSVEYKILAIQKGNIVVQFVEADTNCGIILENITKKDVKKGDKFIFKQTEEQI